MHDEGQQQILARRPWRDNRPGWLLWWALKCIFPIFHQPPAADHHDKRCHRRRFVYIHRKCRGYSVSTVSDVRKTRSFNFLWPCSCASPCCLLFFLSLRLLGTPPRGSLRGLPTPVRRGNAPPSHLPAFLNPLHMTTTSAATV